MKRIMQLWPCLTLVALAASLQTTPAYYDPGIQRWINRDPIGEGGGVNQTTFLKNAPVAYLDPFGLWRFGATGSGQPEPVCKGGQLVIDMGNQAGAPDAACTVAHEQTHIDDLKNKYGPNICRGAPDGTTPLPATADESAFMVMTECKAYKAGQACREDMLQCHHLGQPHYNDNDLSHIADGLSRDEGKIASLLCDATPGNPGGATVIPPRPNK